MRSGTIAVSVLMCVAVFVAINSMRAAAATEDLTLAPIEHDGLQRSYYLHAPANHVNNGGRPPVLLVLHGGGRADGKDLARRTGFNAIADREGVIAVYPNGIDAQWNDGRGVTFRRAADNEHIDDVGFLAAVIDKVLIDQHGDPDRVYVTGLSNGGMMALRMGCEASTRLAAIAPVIANLPKRIVPACAPRGPLPMLLMNGTDDPLVPWNGGFVTVFRKTSGEVISTPETIALWRHFNRCTGPEQTRQLPDRDRDDHSTVFVHAYGCDGRQQSVVLYEIRGGGHNLPGGNTPNAPRLVGYKNNDIVGAEEIWAFLKSFRRPHRTAQQ